MGPKVSDNVTAAADHKEATRLSSTNYLTQVVQAVTPTRCLPATLPVFLRQGNGQHPHQFVVKLRWLLRIDCIEIFPHAIVLIGFNVIHHCRAK